MKTKSLLLALVCTLLCAFHAVAAEGYAVYTSDDHTLTFYYGTKPEGAFGLNEPGNYPQWYNSGTYAAVTRVVFDPSFAQARPQTTQFWFYQMEKLTTITGLRYLNTSNVVNMMYMFEGCHNLESLDLSNFNTSKVENMAYMFEGCNKLTSLDLSKFNTSKVINMSYMFLSCTKLTHLDLSSFDTSNVRSMFSMFLGCEKLTSLNLSNLKTSNVTDMRFMFFACSELKTITVNSSWSTASVTQSDRMFAQCSSIVGGAGTTYNSNHIDKEYARIDGGPSKPGYFTSSSAGILGDVNGDGRVNVSDVTTLINMILGITPMDETRADVNGDGRVNVSDVTALINIILGIS